MGDTFAMPVFNTTLNTPATPCEDYLAMARDFMLVDDLDGGVRRMRWRGEHWLPAEKAETPELYSKRLARSDLFPAMSSALNQAVVKPFSRGVDVSSLPEEWAWVDNVDGEGSDLTQFARQMMRSATKHGVAHVLVDHTAMPSGRPVTKADEQTHGPRPVWKLIKAPDMLRWETVRNASGETVLSEIRFLDYESVDGKTVELLKIIRLNSYEVYRNEAFVQPPYSASDLDSEYYRYRDGRQESWKLVREGAFGPTGGFEALPLVSMYTNRTGFMTARSPLMDLAETNLIHWQSSSDQRNILHVARVPILAFFGFSPEDNGSMTIGANTAISGSSEARVQFVEHGGSAVGLGMDDLESLEERMERLGVRPLVERTGDITATGAAINENRSNTDIQAWIVAGNTALEQVFALSADWLGATLPDDFAVSIFSDFAVGLSDNADMQTLITLHTAGLIPSDVLLGEVKRRGLLSDAIDVEALIEDAPEVERDEPPEPQKDSDEEPEAADVDNVPEPASADVVDAGEPVSKTPLNGAQITSLTSTIATAGVDIAPDAAALILRNGFPTIPEAEIRAMLNAQTKFAGGKPAEVVQTQGGMPANRED